MIALELMTLALTAPVFIAWLLTLGPGILLYFGALIFFALRMFTRFLAFIPGIGPIFFLISLFV